MAMLFMETIMAPPNVDEIVRSLAEDTDSSPETVSELYTRTWNEFSQDARITDYLHVLVCKRVRESLRHQQRSRR